jgi:ribosome-interacting GTPase 1
VLGLIDGAAENRGGGPAALSVARTADLVLFVLSAFEIDQYERLREELYKNKVRLDTEPVRVNVRKKHKGGINLTTSDRVRLDDETIMGVLREYEYINADVTIREDLTIDQLVDALQDNRVYLPSAVAVNKVDLIEPSYVETIEENLREHGIDPEEAVFISAEKQKGLESLKETIWNELGLIRVYMDKPGRGVDYEEPLILFEGDTVGDACEKIGGEFDERFKFARVSGESAKHDDQQVGKGHELADEDVLRIVARK